MIEPSRSKFEGTFVFTVIAPVPTYPRTISRVGAVGSVIAAEKYIKPVGAGPLRKRFLGETDVNVPETAVVALKPVAIPMIDAAVG